MSMTSKIKKNPTDTKARRAAHALGGFEKTITQQAHKAAVDKNNIMAKYRKTGLLDHVNTMQGRYMDATSATDFQDAMTKVAYAQQSFDQLPSEIRKTFDNDAALFLDFVQTPDNAQALVEMGLAKAPEPAPQPKEVAPAAAPTAQAEGATSAD